MNSIISDIIDRNCAKEEKEKALDLLIEEIEMAKGILSGKYQHCDICNDYYLTKSFWRETKTKRCLICVYQDPINSGGNEYRDGYIDVTHEFCPKGHKREIYRNERLE